MEWIQTVTLILGNMAIILPLWLWNRSESRSDVRHTQSIIEAIRLDVKDFHGRLCAIEEKNKSKKG